jgi:DNA-binding transcriptional ArsR family regulator
MSHYTPDGTAPFIPNAVARIERRLPHPGDVRARVGTRVEVEDIVAECYRPEPPQVINIARALSISPAAVERAMRLERNNKFTKGEVLAGTARFGGRTCVAPVSGIIADIDNETGYITLAPDPSRFELSAAVRGVVMEILPYEGVVIETPAAQVYGAFGIGGERSGVLRLMVTDPSEALTPEKIDARAAYAVLICGSTISAAALRRATQEKVRGIIVGGIEEAELRTFLAGTGFARWGTSSGVFGATPESPELTLLVTEGFGVRPMAQPIFDLLSTYDQQEALIEGQTRLRGPLCRPRVVIPLTRSSGAQVEAPRLLLRVGATVRLLDYRHLGAVAQVRAVSQQPRRLPSGVRSPAVEVMVAGEPPFWLPRSAVEVIN